MLPLLPLLALLPEPPDFQVLADHAKAGLGGPAACAAFTADVQQTDAAGVFGATTIAATFAGTLDHGTWSQLSGEVHSKSNESLTVSVGADGKDWEFVPPFFGTVPGLADDFASEGRSLLEEFATRGAQDVQLEQVGVEPLEGRDLYRYERRLSSEWSLFHGRRENQLAVLLEPGTFAPRVWRLDIEDPIKLHAGGKIKAMKLSFNVDPEGWPVSEDLDIHAVLGPFSMEITRSLRYTRGSCAGSP